MTARPILFSAPMVRALLEGRKTQTRRIVKGVPLDWLQADFNPAFVAVPENNICPYGKPGDLLWVRESGWIAKSKTAFIPAECKSPPPGGYKSPNGDSYKSCPSIHMPRWASRLTLELTEVRVERLQDISRTDAAAEGVCLDLDKPLPSWCKRDRWPEENYAALWESINGPGSWEANPWVWALTFRIHQQNIDEFIKSREAA